MKKLNWKALLKVAAIGAGGAVVASPDAQQAILAVIPPPWNAIVGMGLGIVALQLRPAATTPPNETKPE